MFRGITCHLFFLHLFLLSLWLSGIPLGKDQGLKEGKKLAAKENQRTLTEVAILLEYFVKMR